MYFVHVPLCQHHNNITCHIFDAAFAEAKWDLFLIICVRYVGPPCNRDCLLKYGGAHQKSLLEQLRRVVKIIYNQI